MKTTEYVAAAAGKYSVGLTVVPDHGASQSSTQEEGDGDGYYHQKVASLYGFITVCKFICACCCMSVQYVSYIAFNILVLEYSISFVNSFIKFVDVKSFNVDKYDKVHNFHCSIQETEIFISGNFNIEKCIIYNMQCTTNFILVRLMHIKCFNPCRATLMVCA